MSNMVYQGTVWGPPFWNTYFSDSAASMSALGFTSIYYADDLNSFKSFPGTVSDEQIHRQLDEAQVELHAWGRADQVSFDPGKESFHILSRSRPAGEDFTILGITLDCKLVMQSAIDQCVTACGWKLESICRSKRFFCDAELILFYKAHLLSYIEYRTPAIYHSAQSNLRPLDAVQTRFLRQLHVSDEDALIHFRLAPLSTRRDISMLGLIHRTVLGEGPVHFRAFFKLWSSPGGRYRRQRHTRQLEDPCDRPSCPNYVLNSAFGLVAIYNLLPQYVVDSASVKAFQGKLQDIVVYFATTHHAEWKTCLNRSTLNRSPLPRISQDIVANNLGLLPTPRLSSIRWNKVVSE